MKYAAIGPWRTLMISCAWQRGYQFALGQELLHDIRYREYFEICHENGGFIIVDNGAAEGDTPPFNLIVEAAQRIQADEIVLPDVLRDGNATYYATCAKEVLDAVPARKRLIVPQGDNWRDWWNCLSRIKLSLNGEFATIGLPKHLERLEGGRARALQMLIDAEYTRKYHIHMLGVWKDAWKEVNDARAVFPGVRGIDSGLAVACAQKGIEVGPGVRESLEWKGVDNDYLVRLNFANMDKLMSQGPKKW